MFNDFLTLRFNTMSEKELKKEAQKALIDIDISRSYFEKALNITPIKEFGTNYAEHYHSGEFAIAKLLNEKQGQVSGAFYRKELGDIDLVWGDSNFGLKHILDKHGSEFKDIAKELDEIIQNGEVVKNSDRATLQYTKENGEIFKVGLKANWKGEPTQNKWIITAYKDEREMAKTINSSDFTKGETLPLNSSDIIPQTPQEIIKQAKQSGKSVAETAENNTNAWQKEFIEKIKNDKSGKILEHYTQGGALVIERKINDKDLDLISITKGENGELFTTYLGKFITRQEAQKRKSFLDNGFKGKEKELLEFLEKEPVNIGSERIAFIPILDKFFGISSFNGEYFTEFFIHKHFADSKEPFTSMSLGQGKLETAKDNLGRYIDKLFKDNGHPFGFLINNKKTMQRLAKDKELYKVKSKGAIETLLTAKMGHIQGAFYRKELGDIDLVWGEITDLEKHKGYGLAHILDKRKAEFMQQGLSEAEAEAKALELINNIPNIISKGKIIKDEKGRFRIELDNQILGIKDNWHGTPTNKWIITTYEPRESAGSLYTSPTITKGETLPLNSSDIIPQQKKDLAQFVKEYQQEYNALNSKLEAQVEALEKQIQNSSDDEWQKLTFQKIDLLEQQEQAHELFIEVINKLTPHYKNYDEILQITPLNEEHRIILNHRAEYIYQTLLKQAEKKVEAQAPTQQQVKQALEVIDTAFQKRIKEPFAIYEKEWYFDNTKITNLHDAQKFRHTINADKHREYYTDELNKAYSILDKHEEAQTLKEKGVKSTQAGRKTHEDYLNVRDEIQEKAYQAKNTTQPSKQNVSTKESLQKLEAFLHSKNAQNVDSSVESTPPKDTQTPPTPKGLFDEVDSSEPNFTYTTGEAKGIAELRKDLKAALEPSLNKEIVNKETNITATISTKGLTKISSSKAVAKSVKNGFTRDEHFKVAQDLKNLFENSTLKESHADTKARDEIQAVHRFTKDLEINGSQAEAKITLFENNQAGNKIYSIELESLERPTPLSPSATQTKAGAADLTQSVGGDANPTNIAKTDNKIIPQQKIKFAMQKFNYDEKKAKDLLEWHKDSHHLTKDKNGLPKVFYHGSKAKGFEVFDKNRDTSGVGFFFSPSKTRAKKYVKSNGELFEVFIKAKNLFDTSNAVSKEEAKKIFGDRKSIDQALNEQELAFIYSPYQSAYGTKY